MTNNNLLRLYVKTYEDFQLMRIRTTNRLKIKKNKKMQKDSVLCLAKDDSEKLSSYLLDLENQEKRMLKDIKKELKKIPVYTGWLKGVKGVGETLAGYIISNIDIEKATNVSKIWSFVGYNPGLVKGYKWNEKKGVKELTDDMIRGDKLTKGYCSPFNKHLRSKMHVLAQSFIKCKSPYSDIYYDTKNRLLNETRTEKTGKAWSKMHMHLYAIRKMMKKFLIDLYTNWREIENLPVREPYCVEYLNKKHN
jgi:hypothetical protein